MVADVVVNAAGGHLAPRDALAVEEDVVGPGAGEVVDLGDSIAAEVDVFGAGLAGNVFAQPLVLGAVDVRGSAVVDRGDAAFGVEAVGMRAVAEHVAGSVVAVAD